MTFVKKVLLWGLGLLFVLIISLIFLAPALIDSPTLKRKIQAVVSRNGIGQIDYDSVYLSLFPLPHIALQKLNFSDTDRFEFTVEILKIYPELLPLMSGRLRLSELYFDKPELKLDFSAKPVDEKYEEKTEEKDYTLLNITDSIAAAIAPLTTYAPNLDMKIIQGQIELFEKGQQSLSIHGLYLTAGLDSMGSRTFEAKLDVTSSDFKVYVGEKMVVIDCDRLRTSLRMDGVKLICSLDDLTLAQPAVRMSGQLIVDPNGPELNLDLNGQGLDVDAIRPVALNLYGNSETVRDIFAYLQGGYIPKINVHFKGENLADFDDLENFIIKGMMQDGDISIADISMDLSEVNGEVKIVDGLLEATRVTARLGESFGRDGFLKAGLVEDNDTFYLDFMLKAQLEQLPDVLENIIDDEAIIREVTQIQNLKGSGEARILLGDTFDEIKTTIEVSGFQFAADYQRVPFPIKILQGQLIFTDYGIKIKDLSGSVGNSFFSGVLLNIQWQKNLSIDIPSGSLTLDADELYPWLASFETLEGELADVKDVKGHLDLSTFSLILPNDLSEKWQMSAKGEARELVLNTKSLPENLYLSSGKFQITPKQLSFQKLKTRLMDADVNLTGTVSGDLRHPEQIDVTLNGVLGSKAVLFFQQKYSLPDAYFVHAPVKFTETQMTWQAATYFSFKGDIVFSNEVTVAADFKYRPGDLSINCLDIVDQTSNAAISFGINENIFNLKFNGQLHGQTLDRIFVSKKWSNSWLKGNLLAAFVKGKLSQSILKGQLKGGNLPIPLDMREPPVIDKFDFIAQKNRIFVKELSVAYQGNQAHLKGNVDMTRDGFIFDLDASAGDLKWNVPEKRPVRFSVKQKRKPEKPLWQYPFTGEIHLAADSFAWENYIFKPFHADISQIRDGVKVKVNKARLCGIDSKGILLINGNEVDMDFQLTAKDQDIDLSYTCLTDNSIQMTGSFDLSGQIKARGKPEDLFRSAQGKFDFIARKGRITKDKKLSRILEVINFTEIVKGKIPDLRTKGFKYETINVHGELVNEILVFKKFYMDGKTLDLVGQGTLDLNSKILEAELLAAPFKTVDTAIRYIPGMHYLKIGNLVSIPVSIKGDVADPEVDIMSTSAVQSSLKDFAERTIKAPIKFFKSVIPGKENE